MSAPPSIHANCVVVGEAGALVRGRSGAGKSKLSLALVDRASQDGLFARLVADDRTLVRATHERLVASAPASIAGLVERRGIGVVKAPFLGSAVLRLVIDIVEEPARTPSEDALTVEISGVVLPRVTVSAHDPDSVETALFAIRTCSITEFCGPTPLAFAPQHEKMRTSALGAPSVRSRRAGMARGDPDPERNESCAENA